MDRLAKNCAEANSREDVHVAIEISNKVHTIFRIPRNNSLSLTWLHHLVIMKIGWEWTSTRKDGLAISMLHSLLERAFSIAGRIRQGEDNWTFVELSHLLEN
jgi:hypothetical protein